MDFPHTRSLIEKLPQWVETFASALASPHKVPFGASFKWEHPMKDASTVQVAKSVRMASGLRAAMILADDGHTVECGVLLRTISDFAAEIMYVGEGLLENRFTSEQIRFIEQQFSSLPMSVAELSARDPERYVGRKSLEKASGRLADKAGYDKQSLAEINAYLNKGYDGYVHGAYSSAMELFTGAGMRFMLRGSEDLRNICMTKTAIAGKLKEALNALCFMAMTRNMGNVQDKLREAYNRLDASGEDDAVTCSGL